MGCKVHPGNPNALTKAMLGTREPRSCPPAGGLHAEHRTARVLAPPRTRDSHSSPRESFHCLKMRVAEGKAMVKAQIGESPHWGHL